MRGAAPDGLIREPHRWPAQRHRMQDMKKRAHHWVRALFRVQPERVSFVGRGH